MRCHQKSRLDSSRLFCILVIPLGCDRLFQSGLFNVSGKKKVKQIDSEAELLVLDVAEHEKDSDGTSSTAPPHLNIWAGNKRFCLNKFNLTQPEREWLVLELTEWLDLPPKREQHKKRAGNFLLSDVNISSNKLGL